MTALEKVLRLAGGEAPDGDVTSTPDDVRELAKAIQMALTKACESADYALAASATLAARELATSLSEILYTDGIASDMAEQRVAAATPQFSGEIMCAFPSDVDEFGLSVLTQAQRDRYATTGVAMPGGHFPIPDKGHLTSAIARYKQGAHGGQKPGAIASHIRKRAKALGAQVSLSAMEDLASGEALVCLAAQSPTQSHLGDIAMRHGIFNGRHSHAHAVTMVHGHEHAHMNDSMHDGDMHGQNSADKAWAAKGAAQRGGGY